MVMKKSDKAHIKAGEFECFIDKYGIIVNPPMITRWNKEAVQNYIEFLKKLLPYL